jgi:hypothetical protein
MLARLDAAEGHLKLKGTCKPVVLSALIVPQNPVAIVPFLKAEL